MAGRYHCWHCRSILAFTTATLFLRTYILPKMCPIFRLMARDVIILLPRRRRYWPPSWFFMPRQPPYLDVMKATFMGNIVDRKTVLPGLYTPLSLDAMPPHGTFTISRCHESTRKVSPRSTARQRPRRRAELLSPAIPPLCHTIDAGAATRCRSHGTIYIPRLMILAGIGRLLLAMMLSYELDRRSEFSFARRWLPSPRSLMRYIASAPIADATAGSRCRR